MTRKQRILKVCGILFLIENVLIVVVAGAFFLSNSLNKNDAPEFVEEMNQKLFSEGDGNWLWNHFAEQNHRAYKRINIITMVEGFVVQHPSYEGCEASLVTIHKSRSLRGEPFIDAVYNGKLKYPDYVLPFQYSLSKKDGSWSINKFTIGEKAQHDV